MQQYGVGPLQAIFVYSYISICVFFFMYIAYVYSCIRVSWPLCVIDLLSFQAEIELPTLLKCLAVSCI